MGIIEKSFKVNDLINYAYNTADYDVEKYEKNTMAYDDIDRAIRRHRLISGKALHLLERVIDNDGTEDELKRASEWLLMALDMVKYKIDTEAVRRDLNVKELETKFHR